MTKEQYDTLYNLFRAYESSCSLLQDTFNEEDQEKYNELRRTNDTIRTQFITFMNSLIKE